MGHVAAFLGGFAFRSFQIVIESSLYLLIGFLTAGAMRGLIGTAKLRDFFGTGRWTGPLRAWVVAATVLPVCSLGVLPILRELKRAGVRRDAVLTFALAAPMLNPISLMYGFSYLGPGLMSIICLGMLAIPMALGLLSGLLDGGSMAPEAPSTPDEAVPPIGLRRVAASAVHAAYSATGPALRDIALGIAGAAFMAACLQPHWLSGHSFAGESESIPIWASISPLTYVSPEKGMAVLPEMLKFRQSAGAMFCLIVLGVGMSLGTVAWIGRSYGTRTAAAWAATSIALTIPCAYVVDRLAPPVGTANADNDHFEDFANAFGATGIDLPFEFGHYASQVDLFRWELVAAAAALIAAGVMLRRGTFGRRIAFEDFLADGPAAPAAPRPASALHAELSGRLVSAIATGCGLMVLMAGAYAFFPSPEEVFRDMTIIKADLHGEIGAASTATPLHHLDLWDRQAARLPIGAMLRLSPPTEEARRRTAELRGSIHDLRVALEANRRDDARTIFARAQGSLERCRDAYAIR